MDVVSSDDEQVTVQIIEQPFTDEEIERRHETRMAKLRAKHGTDDLWDVPRGEFYKAMNEMAGDYREQLGLTRNDARPAVQMRRTYRLDKLAEKFQIGNSFDTDGWREAVINRVREVKKL